MSKNKSGTGRESQLTRYKNEKRWEKNRIARLERELKRNPNNEKQILAAISNVTYRRTKPKTKQWSSTTIKIATMFKKFKGVCHKETFHSNEKISGPALLLAGPYSATRPVPECNQKNMFSIKERAHF